MELVTSVERGVMSNVLTLSIQNRLRSDQLKQRLKEFTGTSKKIALVNKRKRGLLARREALEKNHELSRSNETKVNLFLQRGGVDSEINRALAIYNNALEEEIEYNKTLAMKIDNAVFVYKQDRSNKSKLKKVFAVAEEGIEQEMKDSECRAEMLSSFYNRFTTKYPRTL